MLKPNDLILYPDHINKSYQLGKVIETKESVMTGTLRTSFTGMTGTYKNQIGTLFTRSLKLVKNHKIVRLLYEST